MKAMILPYETPGDFARRTDKAQFKAYMDGWKAFGGALRDAGVFRCGGALQAGETATVISLRNGKRTVEDGPFADSKEQLGGYFIIEVASLDEAAQWAKQCPAAKNGRVDVRVAPNFVRGA